MRAATADEVWLAVAAPSTWPVALTVDARFRPLSDLADPLVRDVIARRICARIGGAPLRVGQSTLVLGLAARLWSATLGVAATSGVLVDPGALQVRDDDGALHLGLAEATGWTEVTPGDLTLVLDLLAPIIAAIPMSPRLLWGNVASALCAAPRVLRLPQAQPWVDQLLSRSPLLGEIVQGRRTTCCLFYLAPGGGLCDDCVLDHVPTPASRRSAQDP